MYNYTEEKNVKLIILGSLALGALLLLIGLLLPIHYKMGDEAIKLVSPSIMDSMNTVNISNNYNVDLFNFHSIITTAITELKNASAMTGVNFEIPSILKHYRDLANTAIAGFSFIMIGIGLSLPIIFVKFSTILKR